MRRVLLLVIAILLVLICGVVGVGYYFFSNLRAPLTAFNPTEILSPAPTRSPAVSTGAPTDSIPPTIIVPTVSATSTPPPSNSTLDTLLRVEIPENNPLDLVPRFKKISGNFATPAAPKIYRVGDKATFWVSRDLDVGSNVVVTATLRYLTPHAYMWIEDSVQPNGGRALSAAEIKNAADTFESKIYPTDRKYLGDEPNPGVDNDPHIFILNTAMNGGVLGYFSYPDQLPPYVYRLSNEHEMIYMNLRLIRPGSEGYSSTIAHEFAHMIHANHNRREGTWITEGFGDLGIRLNGLPVGHESAFAANPDLQLDAWGDKPSNSVPHYGAAYTFLAYLLNRFGNEFTRDMISSGTHDIATVQKALDDRAPGLKFDDVFADWVVANYAQDRKLGSRYFYPEGLLPITPTASHSNYPAQEQGSVHQYAADYIELKPARGDVTFTFDGSKQVKVVPTDPHSGKMMWWGNHADQSDTKLTREVDLTQVTKATLKFWTWYDIEGNYDYAYVAVSTDGGKTWDTLPGRSTTTEDPNAENYGNGLTCKSVTGCQENVPPAHWLEEQMDLSRYAGKKILLRFEYVADQTTSGNGFAVDDISIPELNFSDDVEQGDNGWQAEGFARIDNLLPQRFIVQAIEYGSTTHVTPVALDANNHGVYSAKGLGRDVSHVVIAISGSTPVTWETASYSYRIQ